MKFDIGDTIVVKQTQEEGRVIDVINNDMVMIEVRGVKFPAYNNQLEYPYFNMFKAQQQKKAAAPKKEYVDDIKREANPIKNTKGKTGVHLLIMPIYDKDVWDEDIVEKFKIYLINYNDTDYNFTYEAELKQETNFALKGMARKQSEFYLHDIDFDDMADVPKFIFEFSLVTPQKKSAPYFETHTKIAGKKLYKILQELKIKNESSFTLPLFEIYPEKEVKEPSLDLSSLSQKGYKMYDASTHKPEAETARTVVDLHIDKLTDDYKNLNNFEILSTQLYFFEKYYDAALKHHLKKLTVIHGIGEGKLKNEIHQILKTKPEVSSFTNVYHPQFGYGATEIYFK